MMTIFSGYEFLASLATFTPGRVMVESSFLKISDV